MKFKIIISSILLTLFCIVPVFSQVDNCADLQKLIDKTYDFKPSKLTENERTAKSAEMDFVWNKVKVDKERLLPCLKKAIDQSYANNFFIFDASNLLFSLDKSDESKKILAKSYAKVDLNDLNLAYWMPYIAILGYEDFDTTAAGENWLNTSNPEYYLPQHGTRKVTKEIGALIIYGSMKEEFAAPALAKIASDEKHTAREMAVRLLMLQATTESFEILKNLNKTGLSENSKNAIKKILTNPKLIAPREGKPKTTREQYLEAFQELVEGKSEKFINLTIEVTDGEKDAVVVMKQEDIPFIRKSRRYFAAIANPHSPEWYVSFTNILMSLVRKNNTENKK